MGLAWDEARAHEGGAKTRGVSSGLFFQQLLGTRPAFGFNLPASFLAPVGHNRGPGQVLRQSVQGTVSALWKLAVDRTEALQDRGPGTQDSSGDPHWGRSFQLLAGYQQAASG